MLLHKETFYFLLVLCTGFLFTSSTCQRNSNINRIIKISKTPVETNSVEDASSIEDQDEVDYGLMPGPIADEDTDTCSYDCGGVLKGMVGFISYKLGTPYTADERCTWIINVPKSAVINLTLVANGMIQDTKDKITVGFFLDSDYKTFQNYNQVVINHNSPNRSVSVPGPIAFVTFISDGSLNGLGFKLIYSGIKTNVSLPFKFRNYFYDTNYGNINYPWNGPYYSHLERISFIIQPKLPVYLALKYFDGNCGVQKDYLTIYQRDRYGTLNYIQQYCNSSVSSVPYWTSNDNGQFLITFHTSISAVNKGFQLIWVPSS